LIHFYKRVSTPSFMYPAMEDDSSDEDFTNMPELCDNEKLETKPAEKCDNITESKEKKEAADDPPLESLKDPEGWEDVLGSGRLVKRVVTPGELGTRPARGARVTVNVVERNMDGLELGRQEELQFNVGESEVVQALDLALPLMEKGEVAEVRSEHTFMYGVLGEGERVEPNTDILLTVELVRWKELGAAPDIPLEERAGIGVLKRERGNRWFTRGEYSIAVQCYRKAAEYLDDKQIDEDMEVPIDRFLLPKPLQEMLEDRVKTFNNMAQAQMKLAAWDSALASVRQVLRIQPNNEKALFRKSKILQEKCQLDEAIGILRRINRLYPANKQCHAELTRLTGKVKASREREQMMSRKMLGLDKVKDNTSTSSLFSRQTSLLLATLGGVGALAGAYLLKYYHANGV